MHLQELKELNIIKVAKYSTLYYFLLWLFVTEQGTIKLREKVCFE